MALTAPELLLAAYRALDADGREEAFALIHKARLAELAADETVAGRLVRSLRRVAELTGPDPSPDAYKTAQRQLTDAGEDVATFHEQTAKAGRTWMQAKEVLALSDGQTPRAVEARLRSRKVGKIWRYSDEALTDVLLRCIEFFGRAPMRAEFDWWRERELERLRTRGDAGAHLPSGTAYRRRFASWQGALEHVGLTPQAASQRLEAGVVPSVPLADPALPAGLPVTELPAEADLAPLDADAAGRLHAAWASLPRRSRYVLTVRLGLDGHAPLTCAWPPTHSTSSTCRPASARSCATRTSTRTPSASRPSTRG